MKKAMRFTAAVILLVFILSGCNNINPAINKSSAPEESETVTSSDTASVPEYLDADALAQRSYELRYLLAQKGFESPDEISVSALVQFAFCHIFYENLTDMPTSGNRIREASTDEIRQQILKYFGPVSSDITKADLYNSGRGRFEMWEPLYGREIYYDVSVSGEGDGMYKVATVFYTDSSKTEAAGRTFLTVEDVSGHIIIKKMTSAS